MQDASHCPTQTDEENMMAKNELKNSNFHLKPYQEHQDMMIIDNDSNFTDDSINLVALSQDQKVNYSISLFFFFFLVIR